MIKFIDYLRDRLKIVIWCCYGLLAAIALVGIAVDKHHAHTWMEKNIPGFWALFGFLACVIIIIMSKWFGHAGIMTREDYYDK
jgi:drug/metabolite transporter (DMT)-like permease